VGVIVIAGFHRSGTSLTADVLHRAGVFLGSDLLGAKRSNPYGHFEDRAFIRLHQDILASAALGWQVDQPYIPNISPKHWRDMAALADSRMADYPTWGFKDPRACWFLAAWKHIIPSMKVVAVYRDAPSCVYSLERRQSLELFGQKGPEHLHRLFWEVPDHGLLMWVHHNRALIDYADAYPDDTLVVDIADIHDGFPLVDAVNTLWDMQLNSVRTFEAYDPAITQRRPTRQPVSNTETINLVMDTWGRLRRLSTRTFRKLREAVDAS
jgi:hypothetical protein